MAPSTSPAAVLKFAACDDAMAGGCWQTVHRVPVLSLVPDLEVGKVIGSPRQGLTWEGSRLPWGCTWRSTSQGTHIPTCGTSALTRGTDGCVSVRQVPCRFCFLWVNIPQIRSYMKGPGRSIWSREERGPGSPDRRKAESGCSGSPSWRQPVGYQLARSTTDERRENTGQQASEPASKQATISRPWKLAGNGQ